MEKWHHHEIAWWLKQIKCDKYAVRFVEEKVSGEQLTKDMTTQVLNTDLGVKMLHCGKIMREIKTLKIQAGLQFVMEHKQNLFEYIPTDEESVTKQLENMENAINKITEQHAEEIKEKEAETEEMREQNEKLKGEIVDLEQQVVDLQKRRRKNSDDSDTEEDEDEEEEEEETITALSPTATPATPMSPEDGDNPNDEAKEDTVDTVTLGMSKSNTSKKPKGYYRKYPKSIRKLMREIDEMERAMNMGVFGVNNKGKFAKTNRAFKWKAHEVCRWLDVRGFVDYIDSFFKNEIDGEILVNDLDAELSSTVIFRDEIQTLFFCDFESYFRFEVLSNFFQIRIP